MRIIGIDPAPRGGLTVFDGDDAHVSTADAPEFISALTDEDDVLVCWDAPLTGPSRRALRGEGVASSSDFTQRPIESFFSRAETGFKTPRGISVRGYSGCPHWAITRSLIGLPRVGPFDATETELPFRLACEDSQKPHSGRWVVEVHPAVAGWLWCRDGWQCDNWNYKNTRDAHDAMWTRVAGFLPPGSREPENHDQLDARIAFVLGTLWLNGSEDVALLGNLELGTFLLPRSTELERAFKRFARGF